MLLGVEDDIVTTYNIDRKNLEQEYEQCNECFDEQFVIILFAYGILALFIFVGYILLSLIL